MEHGKKYEPFARDAYRQLLKCNVVECGLVVSEMNPWLGFSPDGVVVESGRPVKLIEIKCPFEGRNLTIEDLLSTLDYLVFNDESQMYELKQKHSYYGQIQLGMVILNVEVCDFIIYCSKDNSILVFSVHVNHDFLETFLPTLKTKYFSFLLPEICKLNNF